MPQQEIPQELPPRYSECRYSLFISYAHRDNIGNNGFVTNLKEAIFQRLATLDRNITQKEIHFSETNGPDAGTLGSELKDRVGKSFALLLIVGKSYVSSGWCEKELAYFADKIDSFRNNGAEIRLFVAAISQVWLAKAQNEPTWKRVVANDQIVVDFSDPNNPHNLLDCTPVQIHLPSYSKTWPTAFNNKVQQIADPLIRWIENDVAKPKPGLGHSTSSPQSQLQSPWSISQSEQPHIVIGPYTDNLQDLAEKLRGTLIQTGADVTLLPHTILSDYDMEDGKPLRPILEQANVLIVPMSDKRPLRPDLAGGHATILQNEWSKINKAKPIIWYKPPDLKVAQDDLATQKHLDIFSQLAPVCKSIEAVASLIFGTDSTDALKLCIEQHPNAQIFQPLANRLSEVWGKLTERGLNPQKLRITCEPFQFNALMSMPSEEAKKRLKSYDGVVLILPQGIKGCTALRDQQATIEKLDEKSRTIYPGFVALIYKEPNKFPSGEKWTLVEFLNGGQVPVLNMDLENANALDTWLIDLIYRKQLTSPAQLHGQLDT